MLRVNSKAISSNQQNKAGISIRIRKKDVEMNEILITRKNRIKLTHLPTPKGYV